MGTSHHLLHPRNWPKPSNLLKCGKAQGLDNIPPKFLKHLGHNCLSWLREFYSSSLNRVTIPTIWRKATVITVAKPNKPMDDPRSCRPISLLCVPHKLLERLILFRFEPVVGHQLPTQHDGFRSGRCTVQQVVKLTSDIEESYEGRQKAGLVLVDVTASYDNLWHQCLTLKLLQIIPDRHLVHLIVDFISNRSFILKTSDGQCIRLRRLKNGIPQGQRLHLCCLTSISVTSPRPCPPNIAMLMTRPSCFLTSVGMMCRKSFLWIRKESLITFLRGGSGWARQIYMHCVPSE